MITTTTNSAGCWRRIKAMGDGKEQYPMEPGFYNMDCVEAMKRFPDGFFDLAIVDPPYGDGNSGIGGGYAVRRMVQPIQNGGTGSGTGSTDTRNWNRFAGGTTFRKYMRGGRTPGSRRKNRRNMVEKIRQKNHCVGRCPRERVFSGAFPRFTRSNHLGRKLLRFTADAVLSGMAKAEYQRKFQHGDGGICLDKFQGQRKSV